MSGRLGELLVRENLISLQQLQKAQEEQRKTRRPHRLPADQAGRHRRVGPDRLPLQAVRRPGHHLKDFDIDEEVLKLVPKDTAEKHLVIPVNRAGSSLIVAMSDPSNIFAIDDIKFLTGYNIEVVVASEVAIREAIDALLRREGAGPRRGHAGLRRRRGRDRRGRRGLDQRRRPGEERRGGAGRQAGQPDPARRHQEGGLRHPRRALREGLPGPLPHRRRALRGDEAADEAAERHHLPPQDHVASSTSPSGASPRTAASSSSWARARRWTSASPSARPSSARRS